MEFGVQTFTIRKEQKKSLKEAFLPLIEKGILEYEIARIPFNEKTASAVKELVDAYGIRVVSIQVKPKDVFGHMDQVVVFCQKTGCRRVVISMLPFSCILGKEKRFYTFIEGLDAWYEKYEAYGIELGYHHHNWEYVTLSNQKTRMEELLTKTKKIRFVHDTYWTTKCGLSSPKQIRLFGSRLMGIHLRDLALYPKGLAVHSKDTSVGSGVIDFSRVLEEAKKAGCAYYVIEQKTKEPYEDILKSYQYCLTLREQGER